MQQMEQESVGQSVRTPSSNKLRHSGINIGKCAPCKEVYTVIQFLWMKDICPLEFQYQLTKSIWWWHNASAACKKMAEQTSKMMMTAPVSPVRHKLPSHFTGNSWIIHPSVLTLSNQTIHLLRPVKQHLGNLTEGITMCCEYIKTLINIHQASHKKIIII